VGPVLAVGLAASALFGVGGAIAGGAAGHALEHSIVGIPKDELFFYDVALRHGRTLVLAFVDNADIASKAREALRADGADSIDAARDAWWTGVRDDERAEYARIGGNFESDEELYRKGFVAAQRYDCRDCDYESAAPILRDEHVGHYDSPAFKAGYERGHQFYRARGDDHTAAVE
jgi:hypothetical protein